jgi:hypothetical protein
LTHSIFDFVDLSQKRNDVDENDPKADDDHGNVAERGAEKKWSKMRFKKFEKCSKFEK